ncbi:MAG: Outer membrane protein assembly factor BamA [Alphaproteobacteria bacterium MarineAlpha9_Bin3]|nr:MAG: Outer membrane protein assembly factor BamA [Alphaproteobacteria bacterium MarineAlpha9_Bin3]|tara:strand:+ start:14647 stop:16920 length:2274 start_codon:yes stop_codon:yes gene_type:complete
MYLSLRLKIILFTIIYICPIYYTHAQTSDDIISNIKIEGNQRVELDTISSYLNISSGDVFDIDKLNNSLKNLYSTGFFSDVNIVRNGSVILVQVIENPIINRVVFEGNKEIEDEILEAEVSVKSRNLFTRSKIQEDVQRILTLYRNEGSLSSTVKPNIISLDQNRVDVVFEINEGENTIINSITFNGNKEFSDRRLRDVIITRQTRWYSILSASDKYDPQQLQVDENLLRKFYKDNGFADVDIKSAVAQLDREKDGFNIIFTIDEGNEYKYGEIKIISNIVEIDTKSIITQLNMEVGDIYSAGKIEKSVNVITKFVNEQGFPFTEIIPEVDRIENKNELSVIFRINDAEKKYVNRIIIRGNERTLDKVIRRNIRLAEGDAYVPSLLARSKTLISNLGFFSRVDLTESSTNKEGNTDILVDVQETSTGELSFGGGFSSQVGGLLNLGISEKNFLGKGQRVSLQAKFSEREADYTASFSEPYFLNRDLYSSTNLYNNRIDYKESSYELERQGFNVSGNFSLSEYIRQSIRYSLESRKLTPRTGASASIVSEKGETVLSEISSSLNIDTTDNQRLPTEGYTFSIASAFAGLGGDKEFLRINNNGNYYKSFNEEAIIVNVEYNAGLIMGLGQDILISDRYFLGGNSFRGFDQSGVGPRDKNNSDSLGGNLFYTSSIKTSFGVGLPPELGIRANWFTTVGSLTGVDKSTVTFHDDSSIRMSSGVGISWNSPFGPISIIFSQALIKEDYDRTEAISFGIGTKF